MIIVTSQFIEQEMSGRTIARCVVHCHGVHGLVVGAGNWVVVPQPIIVVVVVTCQIIIPNWHACIGTEGPPSSNRKVTLSGGSGRGHHAFVSTPNLPGDLIVPTAPCDSHGVALGCQANVHGGLEAVLQGALCDSVPSVPSSIVFLQREVCTVPA